VYVFYQSLESGAHSDNLQTSIVVDKDWNPLLQDFRLSKVLVTGGLKPKLPLISFPRPHSTSQVRLQ